MKNVEVLLIGGPADGQRKIFSRSQVPTVISVPFERPGTFDVSADTPGDLPYAIAQYQVLSLRSSTSPEHFVAAYGEASRDPFAALLAGYQPPDKDAERFRKIRGRLCGINAEKGGRETVSISHDEAAQLWTVRVGARNYRGKDFNRAIDLAILMEGDKA